MTLPPASQRCEELRDDLAAAAGGTLSGRRRAEVLEHLERCHACAADLDALSSTVDALMTLVPDTDPPPHLADRTIGQMRAEATSHGAVGDGAVGDGAVGDGAVGDGAVGDGAVGETDVQATPAVQHPGRRQRAPRASRRLVLAVAAVVAALAVGIGVGNMAASHGGGAPEASVRNGGAVTAGVRTAALRSATGARGSVVLVPGRPGWLVMTVDDVYEWGTINCQVATANGLRRVVARYPMESAHGSWTARLPVPASSVRSVWLTGDTGATLAWARLPARLSS